MFRAIPHIHATIEMVGFDPTRPEWTSLRNELHNATAFWAEVRGFVGPWDDYERFAAGRNNLRDYLGVSHLTVPDALSIRLLFKHLLSVSERSDDADEGVRLLRDFLQLEDGLSVARDLDLCVNRHNLLLPNFSDPMKEFLVEESDPDFDEPEEEQWDHSQRHYVEWHINLRNAVDDVEWLKTAFPNDVDEESFNNLRSCLRPYASCKTREITEGFVQSVVGVMDFVKFRNHNTAGFYRRIHSRTKPSIATEDSVH